MEGAALGWVFTFAAITFVSMVAGCREYFTKQLPYWFTLHLSPQVPEQ